MKSRYLIACLSLLLATCVEAGPAQTFKIATLMTDGSAWMQQMRAAAAEVSRRTDGRVAFKFYPGSVMGNSQSVLRKIRIGQLHGAAFTGGEISEVYPNLRIYGAPLMFRDQAEVDFVRREMDPVFSAGLEQAGWVNFGFADGGFAVLMSTRQVQRISDIKRQKAWIPEGDLPSYAMLQAVQIPAVTLPLPDVMTGLSTGLIGTIGSSPLGAVSLQWHTKVKYVTDSPFAWLMGVLCIERKQFEKLSPADQAVTREVLGELFRRFDAQNRIDDGEARRALAKQGLIFQKFAPEDYAELERVAHEVNQKLAREGVFDAGLHARVTGLVRQYRAGGAGR